MKSFIAKMSRTGKGYNQYELQRAENQIKEYGDLSWSVNGRPTAMIMAQYPTSSLMFKSVADKVLNGLIFKRLPNGNWNISLYNTNDNDTFHCGKYLKEKYKVPPEYYTGQTDLITKIMKFLTADQVADLTVAVVKKQETKKETEEEENGRE